MRWGTYDIFDLEVVVSKGQCSSVVVNDLLLAS